MMKTTTIQYLKLFNAKIMRRRLRMKAGFMFLLSHAKSFGLMVVFSAVIILPERALSNSMEADRGVPTQGLADDQDNVTITGKVTSDDGEELPGVTVLEKGTSNGVISDIEGNYRITTTRNAVLVFSFVGYQTREVEVLDQTVLNVTMPLDLQQLDEVVVVGYGSVRRRDLTGSVASVKEEDITRIPTHNAMEAIQGRVAGVDIVRSSGAAGAGVNIRIRGNRSIANEADRDRLNSPLYIIDGFQGGSINDLNPNDIASIEVLKDASSTAIYGYQGANGVIIITTKKGAVGKTRVSYSGYYGVNGFTAFPETRRGEEYIKLRREARITSGGDPNSPDAQWFNAQEWEAIQNDEWVDWVDLLMQNGKQQSHTVSVTGGGQNTKAFASIGFFNEESMYRNNNFDRYNVRLNIDHKINTWIKAGLLSQVTYSERQGRRDPLSAAISAKPFGKAYDENGQIVVNPIPGEPNTISPLADEIPHYAVENDVSTTVNLNAYLEFTPLPGLTYRTNLGSRLSARRDGEFFHANSYTRRNQRTSYTGISNSQGRYYHWDNILTYTQTAGDHEFTLTGISNYVFSESDNAYANGLGQQLASQSFYNLGAVTEGFTMGSGFVRSQTISFAARVNYSYQGKYLVTLTNRYDQASMLSEGHRGAMFPSAAVAWRIIEEPFMSGVDVLDDLKIRASYGLVGNSNIAPYATQSEVYPLNNMGFGDVAAPQYQFSGRIANSEVGWEKTRSLDIGIDAGFFGNRLTLTVDAYKSETSDILLLRTIPKFTGMVDIQQNVGSTETKGIELALNSINIDGRNFQWKSAFTFTRASEKISSLVDSVDIIFDETNSWLIGHPVQSFYTFKKLGIWQEHESEEAALLTFGGSPFQPGDIKLKDIDGDSAITAEDRGFIGSAVPKFFLGLQNTFSFKGFELGIYVVGRFGQMIEAEHLGRYDPAGNSGTLSLYDYWTPENPSNDYPRPENTTLSSLPGYQTLPFVDGTYVKLKTVSLGYTFPQKLMERTPLGNLRVYLTGSNLFVKAKNPLLKTYDPESGGSSSYPLNKQVVFGVNLDF